MVTYQTLLMSEYKHCQMILYQAMFCWNVLSLVGLWCLIHIRSDKSAISMNVSVPSSSLYAHYFQSYGNFSPPPVLIFPELKNFRMRFVHHHGVSLFPRMNEAWFDNKLEVVKFGPRKKLVKKWYYFLDFQMPIIFGAEVVGVEDWHPASFNVLGGFQISCKVGPPLSIFLVKIF